MLVLSIVVYAFLGGGDTIFGWYFLNTFFRVLDQILVAVVLRILEGSKNSKFIAMLRSKLGLAPVTPSGASTTVSAVSESSDA